jgi:hypothetical protein
LENFCNMNAESLLQLAQFDRKIDDRKMTH